MKTSSEIIGFIIIIIGIIIGAHTVITSVFRNSLFTTFIKILPDAAGGFSEPSFIAAWLKTQTIEKKPYELWLSVLILPLLLIVLFLTAGCWVFLAFKLTSILNINTTLLVIWFVFNATSYFISASTQAALFVMIKDHRIKKFETITNRMYKNPFKTILTVFKHFLINWIRGPIVTIIEILFLFLIIVLYWPFWLINYVLKKPFDMNIEKNKNSYYIIYGALIALTGALINFLL